MQIATMPRVSPIQYKSFKEFTFSSPPPFEKEERGHIVLHVGRSVDHVMSAQYFFIHLLEIYQLGTLIGCPRVDAPFFFSGHKEKGQGQTVSHCTNDVRSIF